MNTPSKTLISLLSLAALTLPQSAAMAATYTQATWGSENVVSVNHHQTYVTTLGSTGLTGNVDIQWADTDSDNYVTIDNPDSVGQWMNATTPFGKIVGSTYSSTDDRFFKVGSLSDSTLVVTFSSPIPAGHLLWAITDVDNENMTISGQTGSSTAISGANLVGSAAPKAFNFCNVSSDIPGSCSGETSVPRVSVHASNITAVPASSSQGEGETVWGIVNSEISTLTVGYHNIDSSSGSTYRLWFAYSDTAIAGPSSTEGLAATGTTDSANLWITIVAFSAMVSIAGAMAIRRRA